jgi:transposase
MQVDTREDTITNIGSFFGVKSDKLNRHYKKFSSGYVDWKQKAHAEQYLLFPENIGPHLSIDEVSLSQGELYTFVTNKAGKGKQGSLVASIQGTLSKDIIEVLLKLSIDKRLQVKEVTLDMAKNMEVSIKTVFTSAVLVTDRFHVVKLAMEALQHIRIKERWKELDKENKNIQIAKDTNIKYEPEVLANGETPKQLLARCRYILAKKQENWTANQTKRAELLFEKYPHLEKAYHYALSFRSIYEEHQIWNARTRFETWIKDIKETKIEEFNSVANTVNNNLDNILNFFINRNTNANAESFNSKIKLFRANQRGVVDVSFFLFRLYKLFA